jgi:transcriptional regulator with XRE-family HTH domain
MTSAPDHDPRDVFAGNVRTQRTRNNLTQSQLAQRVSTSVQTIRAWESGRRSITEPMMERLASALDLTPKELWPNWTPETTPRGGRRSATPPTSERLDRLEAELIALREELERAGVISIRPRQAVAELLGHLEQVADEAEQRSAGSAGSPDADQQHRPG